MYADNFSWKFETKTEMVLFYISLALFLYIVA